MGVTRSPGADPRRREHISRDGDNGSGRAAGGRERAAGCGDVDRGVGWDVGRRAG